MWFDYVLADRLRMTVAELRRTMGIDELMWWAAYRARVAEIEADASASAAARAKAARR